jgi:mannose-6-phosphate isomerase-like protein (cupin superfamily)
VLLAMPSDHWIAQRDAFQGAMARGAALAEQGKIVAFGVPPTAPETGYGYIKSQGEFLEAFVEKPDAATAAHTWLPASTCGTPASSRCAHRSGSTPSAPSGPDILKACERAYRQGKRDGAFLRVAEKPFCECPARLDRLRGDGEDRPRQRRPRGDGGAARGRLVRRRAPGTRCGASSRRTPTATSSTATCTTADTKNALLISQPAAGLRRPRGRGGRRDRRRGDGGEKDRAPERRRAGGEAEGRRPRGDSRHRKVQRPWGSYDGIESGERFQVKRIVVDPGASLSLQMHYHRAEHWIVVRGTARVTRGDETFLLTENESTYIPPGTRHRLENPASCRSS